MEGRMEKEDEDEDREDGEGVEGSKGWRHDRGKTGRGRRTERTRCWFNSSHYSGPISKDSCGQPTLTVASHPTHPSSHGSPMASSATNRSYSSAAYFSQSVSSGLSL